MLADGSGNILDSVSFGPQTADVSIARCPNGTGPFTVRTPTFGTINCPVGIEEQNLSAAAAIIFPNPTSDELNIQLNNSAAAKNESQKQIELNLYNIIGEKVMAKTFTAHENRLSLRLKNFPAGIYFLSIDSRYFFKVEIIKP